MKNYQPDYYNNFKCIADKCSITCCQEWKIAVDDATNRKWKKLSPPDTLSAAPFSADKVAGKSDNLALTHAIRMAVWLLNWTKNTGVRFFQRISYVIL